MFLSTPAKSWSVCVFAVWRVTARAAVGRFVNRCPQSWHASSLTVAFKCGALMIISFYLSAKENPFGQEPRDRAERGAALLHRGADEWSPQ